MFLTIGMIALMVTVLVFVPVEPRRLGESRYTVHGHIYPWGDADCSGGLSESINVKSGGCLLVERDALRVECTPRGRGGGGVTVAVLDFQETLPPCSRPQKTELQVDFGVCSRLPQHDGVDAHVVFSSCSL